MATIPLIKQTFGNHDMVRQYLESLRDPNMIPPFPPVLYRQIAHCVNDTESITINEKEYHKAKNRQVMNQLVREFDIYQQLNRTNTSTINYQ